MLFQVYTENGVKKIKPLTADTGTGAPVGSYLMLEKKSNPQGYLYCDGSTFDSTAYPALYQYLGSNVLPDFREFSPVGAEQNTTNVYDASTNPDGTIHTHDVYTEGQAKDDQLQNHTHYIPTNQGTEQSQWVWKFGLVNGYAQDYWGDLIQGVYGARVGDVTRGKRKAVFVYIKATSGLTENQQENVLNTINDNLSYSTTEHKTGKKWIDGKDIYSKTIYVNNMADFPISTGITGTIEEVVKISAVGKDNNGNFYQIPYYTFVNGASYFGAVYFNPISKLLGYEGNLGTIQVKCTLEYTKTT